MVAPTAVRRPSIRTLGRGQMLPVSRKPSHPLLCIAWPPSNEWHFIPAHVPSQISFAIFTFCQDKVSWQPYPRNQRPIAHQLYWEVTSQKCPEFGGPPFSCARSPWPGWSKTAWPAAERFPTGLFFPKPRSCFPPAISLVGQEQEVARDAHQWQKEKWRRASLLRNLDGDPPR